MKMLVHNNEGCVSEEAEALRHEYAERVCPACNTVFCHACCAWTNRHHGGKHEPDSTLCPVCDCDVDASA